MNSDFKENYWKEQEQKKDKHWHTKERRTTKGRGFKRRREKESEESSDEQLALVDACFNDTDGEQYQTIHINRFWRENKLDQSLDELREILKQYKDKKLKFKIHNFDEETIEYVNLINNEVEPGR